MWILLISLVGLVIGDGLFVYWLLFDYQSIGAVLQDRLAMSFMIDAALTLAILSVYFARNPPGKYRWPWFVVLSLLGGLCFGVPFYWWLNKDAANRHSLRRN